MGCEEVSEAATGSVIEYMQVEEGQDPSEAQTCIASGGEKEEDER